MVVVLFSSSHGTTTQASVFMIPPRDSVRGHVSGTWRHDDCLCDTISCRIEKEDDGCLCVIRLIREDASSGESLFAMSRIPLDVPVDSVVESACDSSRNFVIRVEDPETKRHAFLGLSFEDRSVALDFRMVLSELERKESMYRQQGLCSSSGNRDLRLKEGDVLHLSIPGVATAGEGKNQQKNDDGFVSSPSSSFVAQRRVVGTTPTTTHNSGNNNNKNNRTASSPVVARDTQSWETF